MLKTFLKSDKLPLVVVVLWVVVVVIGVCLIGGYERERVESVSVNGRQELSLPRGSGEYGYTVVPFGVDKNGNTCTLYQSGDGSEWVSVVDEDGTYKNARISGIGDFDWVEGSSDNGLMVWEREEWFETQSIPVVGGNGSVSMTYQKVLKWNVKGDKISGLPKFGCTAEDFE